MFALAMVRQRCARRADYRLQMYVCDTEELRSAAGEEVEDAACSRRDRGAGPAMG